jgi:prolyl 4-hydroxylase
MNFIFILFLLILFAIILYFTIHPKSSNVSSLSPTIHPPSKGKYKVHEYPNLLSAQECDMIIDLAKKNGLSQSHIVSDDKLNAYDTNFRKSDQTWMSRSSHPVLEKLSKISEKLTSLPQVNQEMIQVVRYEKGGKFDAHFDPCVKGEKLCKEMNRGAGQRRTTLLVYLNDVLKGGETEFVNIGVKVRPEKGKGILFWSTDEDEKVLEESKHRGNELLEGEKWIATIWSHPMVYN